MHKCRTLNILKTRTKKIFRGTKMAKINFGLPKLFLAFTANKITKFVQILH